MKHGHALAIGTLALALAACGGGSHHSGTTTTTDPTTVVTTPGATPDYRIEAVINKVTVSAGPSSGGVVDPDPGYRFQDLQNIELRDNITFQLVYYTGSGTGLVRHVLDTVSNSGNSVSNDPIAAFSTNDSRGLAGTLSPTDGTFVAGSNAVGPYTVTATANGLNYTASYTINPRQIRLHGAVVVDSGSKDGNGNPVYRGVYNAQVDFYEARSSASDRQVVVQSVHTADDGTFRASIPAPTNGDLRFVVRPPTGYSTTFSFGGTSYTPVASPTQDQILNEYPSLASTVAPDGTYLSGDKYLVQGTGLSTSTDSSASGSTFNFLTQDDYDRDAANLIVLTADGASSSSVAKKKGH